jgi:hypothetical protein
MNPDPRKWERFWEGTALITALGFVIGFGLVPLAIFLDWHKGHLKEFGDYLRLGGITCLPFVLLFLISSLLLWRCRRKPNT